MADALARLSLSRSYQAFRSGVWDENPVFRQVLGICSTLAVTNLLANTAVMCAGLVFVLVCSNGTVSALRGRTPARVRMMVQVLIIASYVVVFKMLIDAYVPHIAEELGAYVGLIITNCIIMGRTEGFASANPVWPSLADGLGCGIGYSLVLLLVAFVRELMGFGTVFGLPVLGAWWPRWTIMVMPPGAFFTLALVVWACRRWTPDRPAAMRQ
jgi:Na+-transporting NADH:ubiquinone oxidoreductase subunit D